MCTTIRRRSGSDWGWERAPLCLLRLALVPIRDGVHGTALLPLTERRHRRYSIRNRQFPVQYRDLRFDTKHTCMPMLLYI